MFELNQEFRPSPEFDIAVRYHVECELYDREICTGPAGPDGVMPTNPREMALITRNACSVRKTLSRLVKESGWNPSEFARLIRRDSVIREAQRQLQEIEQTKAPTGEES